MSDTLIVEPTVYAIDVILPAYEVSVSAPGPQGIQGPAGVAANTNFTHTQLAPATTWNITHNLGYNPSATAVDTAGNVVEGTLLYIDTNTLEITFGIPVSGHAYMS